MQIRFKATEDQAGYNGFWKEGSELIFIKFTDGQVQDIPDGKVQELLRDFPRNFVPVGSVTPHDITAPPKDRMIRKAKTK